MWNWPLRTQPNLVLTPAGSPNLPTLTLPVTNSQYQNDTTKISICPSWPESTSFKPLEWSKLLWALVIGWFSCDKQLQSMQRGIIAKVLFSWFLKINSTLFKHASFVLESPKVLLEIFSFVISFNLKIFFIILVTYVRWEP